ncbi:Thioredoxin, mitochondrial [Harpegnathos saltator]|uniref:Thioredoxin, mitochondrial n=1 Tax=Harpegnathos saltator TaxID=610380 RepID=E2BW53_HARSA|nr:Thioredoxin, mitochondrial [Harpegnathos saltator]
MTTLIFGVGIGLFIILSLWALAALIFLISLRIEKKVGIIAILLVSVFTIILISVPRASEKPAAAEDKVMNGTVPVIVNFHAEWCDPCRILTPKLIELIEPMEKLDLAIINVEENPELVHVFEVKAVPAVIAISNGLVVDKFIGLVNNEMIENLIQKLTHGGPIDTESENTKV